MRQAEMAWDEAVPDEAQGAQPQAERPRGPQTCPGCLGWGVVKGAGEPQRDCTVCDGSGIVVWKTL